MNLAYLLIASMVLATIYFVYTVWYDRKHNYDW